MQGWVGGAGLPVRQQDCRCPCCFFCRAVEPEPRRAPAPMHVAAASFHRQMRRRVSSAAPVYLSALPSSPSPPLLQATSWPRNSRCWR